MADTRLLESGDLRLLESGDERLLEEPPVVNDPTPDKARTVQLLGPLLAQ
jgi:hypothetical protein